MRQTRILFFALFLFFSGLATAQEQPYIIEGDTILLHHEVKGPLSLFWTEEGRNFRYFVQKKDRLIELREVAVAEKKDFRGELEDLTQEADIRTEDLKFVLYSLRHFVNTYNALVQADYVANESTPDIHQRIGLFVGLSNNIYTENPGNTIVPVLGLEYEFFDPNLAPRHAAFLQLRQSFRREEYAYSSTQLSLNYRFRAIYGNGFDIHFDAELATFLYSQDKVVLYDDQGNISAIKDDTGFTFTAPFSFGVGSDIRITDRSFITFSYNDVVSLVLDANGSFPIDFTIGYKYDL